MTKALQLLGILLTVAAVSCGGGDGAASGGSGGANGRGGMPAMPVDMITVEAKPVEQTGEFVGTVKSRRQTNVQPQVEGFITRINVKAGDRVNAGAQLMQIDSRSQQAGIVSLESVRAQRQVDLTYAQQEADRAQKLLAAGAGSQMDADRAANAVKAAQAQLHTVEEQIRQLRTDLGYYSVTAPTAGIVGDIPVHEGDRVTKTTELTTIDAQAGLEVYLNIPVQQAPQLKIGLPVRLVDDAGQPLATESINFISPSVDTTTQTVLAKVPLTTAGGFRTSQFVRAQVLWSTDPGITIPVTSVIRINGQFFAYVAEPAGSGFVARQRAVTLGRVIGNDYVVLGGLKPGDKLIVSGIQKIGDGAPVKQGPPAAPPGSAAGAPPAGGGR
jgi:RND family efflux transporter MFP subunit